MSLTERWKYLVEQTFFGAFLGLLAIAAFIVIVIGAFATVGNENARIFDAQNDSFQEIYAPTGLFGKFDLEPLGPSEINGSEFHGTYFASFFLIAGQAQGSVNGEQISALALRFNWIAPNGVHKTKDYPYEQINQIINNEFGVPKMEFVFTKSLLEEQFSLSSDYTIYDFNVFFDQAAAINIYMNEETYQHEKELLKLK